MKKGVFAVIALIAILLSVVQGGPLFYPPLEVTAPEQTLEWRTLQLKGQAIYVSVADTEETRRQGLSGHPGLAADEGMLFVFPKDGEYAFWMKDMRFSIDILWLSSNGSIVYMAQNVSPDTYPHDFVPAKSARYVLELPAGYAVAHGIVLGDIVRL